MANVAFEDVGKVYVDGTRAVDGLSLDIADGEFLVLVGPSGCGKTTALRMAAGLEDISEGAIRIGGRVVNGVPSRDRDVAMIFQSYALYPHLDVYDNIAFGLKLRRLPSDEIKGRVKIAAATLGLGDYLHRRPPALSGGQRQRVAMGRAIVRQPSVFLMDEPLSNLDAKLRGQMRVEIARNSRRLGVTTIYVTHDQTEAMTLGHRVAVMKRGHLQQVAPPQELYERPVNIFVAGFIGSPAMNLLTGTLAPGTDGPALVIGDQWLRLEQKILNAVASLPNYRGLTIGVGIRPEDVTAATPEAAAGTTLTATVELIEALGSDLLVHCGIKAQPVVTDDTKELAKDGGNEDDPATESAAGSRYPTTLVGRLNPRARVRDGERIRLAVDTARLHLFDLATGRAII